MINTSLFAEQKREAKLNKLGDTLLVIEQHVDFTAVAAEVDLVAPRPSRALGDHPMSESGHDSVSKNINERHRADRAQEGGRR